MNNFKSVFSHYSVATGFAFVVLVIAAFFGGPAAILPIIVLVLVELTFSFENAVVNSQVLGTMNRFWQRMFLTVGIAVAVFGVRLLLPLFLVSTTANHSLGFVFDLALNNPDVYAEELKVAYPIIASFGGVFLLMIGLRFFGEKKEVVWLDTVEAPLAEFNQPWWVSLTGAAVAIAAIYTFLAPGDKRIVVAGMLGAAAFLSVKVLGGLLIGGSGGKSRFMEGSHGHGFMQFIYLELLDASFSFDGVIAAFAITKEVLLISAGLGIGALYVRSMTVHLLKNATLSHYRYLVHGAHYAILALAVMLLIGIKHELPEVVTGLLGLTIIAAAFKSSINHNRRELQS